VNITEIDKNIAGGSYEFTVRYADVPLSGILGRVIRNPGYGGPGLSIHGWTWRQDICTHRKPKFQDALRESIAAEGFRNPVIIYAADEGDFLSFGGSRLRAARDLGVDTIPALVNDYVGRYSECPLVTPENVHEFFTDVPQYVEFTPTGVDSHYSLERNRRDHYDPAGMNWCKGADFINTEFSWIPND